jgi:Domain of unknown function (DUF4384)
MGTRPSYLAARTVVLLSVVAAMSACATTQAVGTAPDGPGRNAVAERGPRVRIWTTDEFGTGSRVRAAFRLDDDAYVAVVNVGLDGYASVIFPESPDDDGFMRGGRTYRLPSFFPGFANHFHASRYSRLYNAAAAYDGFYDRYAGYVFIIASWRPMNFAAVEEQGLWDDYRLAAHERQLEPYEVIHQFAQRLVPGRARDYSAHFARYAAFSVAFGRGGSLASCLLYGSTLGSFPWWTLHATGSWWTPYYGLGYYGAGRCPYAYGVRFATYRTRRGVGIPPVQPATPPVRPAPPPNPGDSAARPKRPHRPRTPVATDGGRRKPIVRVQGDEDETIIDVTRESRELARRRDRDADRTDGPVRRRRGYGAADDWVPPDRARTTERTDERWDADREPRGRRAPVDHDARTRARDESSRGESARSDQRTREPRREPARPVEKSQPRQDTRPQPAPRSEPAARPAPRPEPRGERPANPAGRR